MSEATLGPGVFFDRDGTLINERVYLSDPERAVLIATAPRALADLGAAGFKLVIVTNQSGIARGLYTEIDYHAVAKRVDELLVQAGASVDETVYCPHHPDFGGPCDCRKPLTGMYRQAAEVLGIDLARSFYVGDSRPRALAEFRSHSEGPRADTRTRCRNRPPVTRPPCLRGAQAPDARFGDGVA